MLTKKIMLYTYPGWLLARGHTPLTGASVLVFVSKGLLSG